MDEIHKVMLMPGKDALCNEAFSPAQWLNYYLNVWTRNLVARTIDVETDRQLKEIDPERPVQNDDGRMVAVKERLEHRKILVQDGLDLVNAIKALIAIPEADFVAKTWSAEALKVDGDMLPAEPKAGDTCTLADNVTEGVLAEMDGQLVCVDKPTPAEEAVAEAEAAPAPEAAPEPAPEVAPEAPAGDAAPSPEAAV
jgi:hypothetical protein